MKLSKINHQCILTTLIMITILGLIGNVFATTVMLNGRQLFVDGAPFTIKGVGYSPVPIGVDPETTPPYGDYLTSDQSPIYDRDLPLIRQMGANTIRLWGWNNSADHTDFLDKAYNNGVNPIYVIVTFWMGHSLYPDISSPSARAQIKANFSAMVAAHKDHPVILMWSIGNELNASWMYEDRLADLFSLINEMAEEAHQEEGISYHPVTTPLLDNNLINTIGTFDPSMTSLDVWGANVYRGQSFGTLFDDYRPISSKPLLILEYGIDAYDHQHNDEYENIGLPQQAIYAEALWKEIKENSDVCPGGTIMVYSDEWWKGKYSTDPGCPDYDPALHSKCGYPTDSHPDGHSNEEWWGIMRTVDNGNNPDLMEPREVYYTLQSLWKTIDVIPPSPPKNLRVVYGSIILAWDANTEPDIAGYKVYYSTVSRSVTGGYYQYPPIEVANVPNPTCILNLEAGKSYYIAVIAYDTSRNESDYSAELKRQSYIDVPANNWAYDFVMAISDAGITSGCQADDPETPDNEANFCPNDPITRGQMAVFIEASPGHPPNTCDGRFADVPTSHPFCGFIERLADDGITGGCGTGNFCPNDPVTRGQMAVFIEAALGHSANTCTGRFGDVPIEHPFCGFVEKLAEDGITGGCSDSPLMFCPDNPVTRAQMAVLIVAAPNPLKP